MITNDFLKKLPKKPKKRDFLKELWALTGEIGCEAEDSDDKLLGEVYERLADVIDFMWNEDQKRCEKIADEIGTENEKTDTVHIRIDEELRAYLKEISKSMKLPLSTTVKVLLNELKEKYPAKLK